MRDPNEEDAYGVGDEEDCASVVEEVEGEPQHIPEPDEEATTAQDVLEVVGKVLLLAVVLLWGSLARLLFSRTLHKVSFVELRPAVLKVHDILGGEEDSIEVRDLGSLLLAKLNRFHKIL